MTPRKTARVLLRIHVPIVLETTAALLEITSAANPLPPHPQLQDPPVPLLHQRQTQRVREAVRERLTQKVRALQVEVVRGK